MAEFRTTSCCGLREFHNLVEDARENMLRLSGLWLQENTHGDTYGAFIVFSDHTESPRGSDLASFILENELGTIQQTEPRHNPSSDNDLVVYLYTPDNDAMRTWREAILQENRERQERVRQAEIERLANLPIAERNRVIQTSVMNQDRNNLVGQIGIVREIINDGRTARVKLPDLEPLTFAIRRLTRLI